MIKAKFMFVGFVFENKITLNICTIKNIPILVTIRVSVIFGMANYQLNLIKPLDNISYPLQLAAYLYFLGLWIHWTNE